VQVPRVAALVACGILWGPLVSGQSPGTLSVRPLPPAERLVTRPLAVTLRPSATHLPFGQAPGLTLVVRNTGRETLLVHPAAVSNLRIYTADGRFVAPFSGAIFEYIAVPVRRGDLIELRPGAKYTFAVRAEFHAGMPHDGVSMYWRQNPGGPEEFPLPPGDYALRFTYVSYPDYGVAYAMTHPPQNIWYGRVEAPSVPFTVLPPADAQVRRWIAGIDGRASATEAIAAVRGQRVAAAVDPLLRRFERVAADRPDIIEAIADIDAPRGAPRLLELIAALPDGERRNVIQSTPFWTLVREVPCAPVPLVIDAIQRSPSAIEATFGGSARPIADCPALTDGLRALIRIPLEVPTAQGGWPAYPRAGAIEALGWRGDRSDVPLLASVLDRSLAGLPTTNAAVMDVLRQAAAKALGRIGGPEAGQALVRELRDPDRNRNILTTLAEEATRVRADGAAAALQGLLAHRAPIVRESASRALLALSEDAGALAVPDDSSPATKYNALKYLVRHGRRSDLPRFVAAVVSGGQYEREAGVEGIDRFGDASAFVPLRAALETASADNYLRSAIYRLTFMPIWGQHELREWDAWWTAQAGRTREDWAQDALDRSTRKGGDANAFYAAQAVGYFATSNALSERRIEQALASGSWMVRAAVADALAPEHPARAASIYLGELESRYLGACRNAAQKLATLAKERADVDCTVPAEREQAKARWSGLLRE
jgi:HEAT repeat protein